MVSSTEYLNNSRVLVVAPDSWMTAFNAISEEGQKCLLKASSDPANKELYRTNNPENMKKDLQNRCPNDIKELSAFVDVRMYRPPSTLIVSGYVPVIQCSSGVLPSNFHGGGLNACNFWIVDVECF